MLPRRTRRLDRIGVVGTSYRKAHVDELAAAALPADFEHEQLVELARLAGFSELVYLGTCNRVEFYFRGETRIHTNPLLFHLRSSLADLTDGNTQLPDDDRLYVHFGPAAVRHLFRVTSALDSMMVGEAQIAGQTKEAHERAHNIDLLGGILDQTFHEAFHLAKRIRTETELTRRPVSLVTLVERRLHDHLESNSAPVLILGAGEMAGQALRLIRNTDPNRHVLVANRTPERAREMVADDPHAEALFMEATLAMPPAVGLVVAATSSDQIMLNQVQVQMLRSQLDERELLLLVDLAMPPNLDPDSPTIPGVELHGIEEMREEAEHNRECRLAEMDRCEKMVDHQIETLRRHLLDRALSPAAQGIHQNFRDVADRALKHSLNKELAHLDAEDREAVERMTAGLVKRLVQVPVRGLKGAAWHHSSAVIDGFIKGLNGDLDNDEGQS
jgi:glutamyl-tRNA reductase